MDLYAENLRRRIDRQRAFHQSRRPGDLLVYVNRDRFPWLESYLQKRLAERTLREWLHGKAIDRMIAGYVDLCRAARPTFFAVDDDCVPSAVVYWGIGGITSAMCGLDFSHDGSNSWLEPNLTWDAIERLRFDPDSAALQFALSVNQALWRHWEEDFVVMPFLHRSPLDAANGLRGTELFSEMYAEPASVKRLIDWCADWSLQTERFLAEQVTRPAGWGTGAWSTWLPEGAVFVNGDPVGLISPEMCVEFDRPYTGKLFTATRGGFFHNHTVGLYQVLNVARTPGILVQEFIVDPKQPNLPQVMLSDPARREEIIEASLVTPVMIEGITPGQLDRLLPCFARGRFILSVAAGDVPPADIIAKVRKAAEATLVSVV